MICNCISQAIMHISASLSPPLLPFLLCLFLVSSPPPPPSFLSFPLFSSVLAITATRCASAMQQHSVIVTSLIGNSFATMSHCLIATLACSRSFFAGRFQGPTLIFAVIIVLFILPITDITAMSIRSHYVF